MHPELRHALSKIERKIDEAQQTSEGHGDNDKRNQAVSNCSSSLSPANVDHSLGSEQVSGSRMEGSRLLMFMLAYSGNLLLHRQELVSDVMSSSNCLWALQKIWIRSL